MQMRAQALSTDLETLCVDASGGPLWRLRGPVLAKRISVQAWSPSVQDRRPSV